MKRRNNVYPDFTQTPRYIEHPSYRHHYYGHHYDGEFGWSYCWWIIFILLIGLIVVWIVLVAVNTPTAKKEISFTKPKTVLNCTRSETYDPALNICFPKTHFPIAVDNSIMDNKIQACDSFYHHSCGTWIKNHENQDRSFTAAHMANQNLLKEIITDKENPKDPVYQFYHSCLKNHDNVRETHLEQRHLMRIIIDQIRGVEDLPVAFARLSKYGFTSIFSFSIEKHPREPLLVPMIMWDGYPKDLKKSLVKELFQSTDRYAQGIMKSWSVNVKTEKLFKMLKDIGRSSQRNNLEKYVDYVKGPVFKRDMKTIRDLPDWPHSRKGDGWKEFFEELDGTNLAFKGDHPAWVPDLDYLKKVFTVLQKYNYMEWRVFVEFSIAYNTHQFIPRLPSNVYFRKSLPLLDHRIERELSSIQDKKKCIQITNYMLPGLVAQKFLQKGFPQGEKTRTRIIEMVERLKESYIDLLTKTSWMDQETKEKSIQKIKSIIVRVIHPNTWNTEPFKSRISKDRWLHNVNMIRKYRVQRNLELWHRDSRGDGILYRDEVQRFGAPLSTVNAYYSPVTNTITIFAGILREPFYHTKFNQVSLWARVGSIVGHELSHALDNSGRQFDLEGSIPVEDWWTANSIKGFKKQSKCIMNEYGPPQGCPNAQYGRQTLGEDISDLVGLNMAYNSFLKENPSASRTDKQWFFTSFAQMWCSSFTPEKVCEQVKNDVHAIPWFRVDNTLRQMDAFKEAFGCSGDDSKMINKNKCVMYG